jgi:hypothetical protein
MNVMDHLGPDLRGMDPRGQKAIDEALMKQVLIGGRK